MECTITHKDLPKVLQELQNKYGNNQMSFEKALLDVAESDNTPNVEFKQWLSATKNIKDVNFNTEDANETKQIISFIEEYIKYKYPIINSFNKDSKTETVISLYKYESNEARETCKKAVGYILLNAVNECFYKKLHKTNPNGNLNHDFALRAIYKAHSIVFNQDISREEKEYIIDLINNIGNSDKFKFDFDEETGLITTDYKEIMSQIKIILKENSINPNLLDDLYTNNLAYYSDRLLKEIENELNSRGIDYTDKAINEQDMSYPDRNLLALYKELTNRYYRNEKTKEVISVEKYEELVEADDTSRYDFEEVNLFLEEFVNNSKYSFITSSYNVNTDEDVDPVNIEEVYSEEENVDDDYQNVEVIDKSISMYDSHLGVFTKAEMHIPDKIKHILRSLPVMTSSYGTTNKVEIDIHNHVGLPINMDGDSCANILYMTDVTSKDRFIESIKSISNNMSGYEGLIELYNILKDNDSLASLFYSRFRNRPIDKVRTIIDDGNLSTVISNPNATRKNRFINTLFNTLRSNISSLNASELRDILPTIEEIENNKGLYRDDRTIVPDNILNNIYQVYKRIFNISADSFYSFINNDNSNETKFKYNNITKLSRIINDIVKTINNKKAIFDDKGNINNEEFNNKFSSDILTIANLLIDYTPTILFELNSTNPHGNQSSSVINSSYLTNMNLIFSDKGILKSFVEHRLKSNQYRYSNLLIEHKDDKGIVNFGLIGSYTDDKLTLYASDLISIQLYDGVSNYDTGKGSTYQKHFENDYVVSQYTAFINSKVTRYKQNSGSMNFATYLFRTPSDASNNFTLTTVRYSVKDLINKDGTINKNSVLFKLIKNQVKQEVVDAAEASNFLFEYVDIVQGDKTIKVIKRENNDVVFKEGIDNSNPNNTLYAYQRYHYNGSNFIEKTNGAERLTGNVFKSYVLDTDKENYGNELMKSFDFLFIEGGDINSHVDFVLNENNKVIDVNFNESQEKAIDDAITKYIQAVREDANTRLIPKINKVYPNVTEESVLEFMLNYQVVYGICNDIFESNIKFYSDTRGFLKRAKELQGSGISLGNVDFTKLYTVFDKVEIPSVLDTITFGTNTKLKMYNKFTGITIKGTTIATHKSESVLRNKLKSIGVDEERIDKLLDRFKDTKANDAQSYITVDEWVRRIVAKGQLDEYKDLIDKIYSGSELNESEISRFVQVQKNFYFDHYYNEHSNIFVGEQIKNAEFVLVPQFIKGTELELLAKLMNKYNIDQVNTDETSKAGKTNVVTVFNPKIGDLEQDIIDELNGKGVSKFGELVGPRKRLYSYEFLFTQQETPQHINDFNKVSIQLVKKMLDNIDESSPLWQTKVRFQELYCENIKESAEEFFKHLNVKLDDNGNLKLEIDEGFIKINSDNIDYKYFYDLAKSEMQRLKYNSNLKDYVTLLDDDKSANITIMPSFMSMVNTKLINIAQSLFNNHITKQKLPGFHAVQVSNIGFKKLAGKSTIEHNGSLRYHTDKDGNYVNYIEIMLPKSAFNFTEKDLEYIDGETEEERNKRLIRLLEDRKLDKIIGQRIPTEGKQSIAIMKVVDFIPDGSGSTIIVPNEWVSQTGADFDIDSIYGIQHFTSIDKNGNITKYDKGNKRKIRSNEITDCMFEILEHDDSLEETLSCSNYDDITEEIKSTLKKRMSTYNVLDQAELFADAIAGRALKGISVAGDNMISICNTVKPVISDDYKIPIAYNSSKFSDTATLSKRYGKEISSKEGITVVEHNMYGWSHDFKSITGDIITVHAAQTTAHILDVIKVGSIPNVNIYTFPIVKTLAGLGVDYHTIISFITQPIIKKVLDKYAENNSIFVFNKSVNPIDEVIIDSIKKITGNNELDDLNSAIANYFEKEYNEVSNNLDPEDNSISILDATINKIAFDNPLNINNEKTSHNDIITLLHLKRIKNLANYIGNLTRVCNPDKFGAKQTLFATEKTMTDIQKIVNFDASLKTPIFSVNGKSFLTSVYPHIDKGYITYFKSNEKSTYPIINAFLKHSTLSSLYINSEIFLTQDVKFRMFMKELENKLGMTLSEKQYNQLEKYIIGELYNDSNYLMLPITYNKRARTNLFTLPTDLTLEKLHTIKQEEYKRILGIDYETNPTMQVQETLASTNNTQYVNHSGGAEGSDYYWGTIAKEYGIESKHYYTGERSRYNAPYGNSPISDLDYQEGVIEATKAAKYNYGYSYSSNIKDPRLIRNWSQVKYADAIFAIGHIVNVGNKLFPNIKNPNENRVAKNIAVQGGTGYAVAMAILNNKPVYIFDQERNQWYQNVNGVWSKTTTPTLTPNFAGIGTREINDKGKQAIRDVFAKTFNTSKNNEEKFNKTNESSIIISKLVPFKIQNIKNPTQEEINAFAKLTPAQKVKYIKDNFDIGNSVLRFITPIINLSSDINVRKANKHILEYSDELNIEDVFEELVNLFNNTNPLIALTVYDIIKYAFIAEGYNMKKNGVSSIVPNKLLYFDFNKGGIGLRDDLMNKFKDFDKSVTYKTNELIDKFVMGNHKDLYIPTTRLRRDKNGILPLAINSNGLIILKQNLSGFKLAYDYKILDANDKKHNYIKLKYDNRTTLYKVISVLDDYVLIPLQDFDKNQHINYTEFSISNPKYNAEECAILENYIQHNIISKNGFAQLDEILRAFSSSDYIDFSTEGTPNIPLNKALYERIEAFYTNTDKTIQNPLLVIDSELNNNILPKGKLYKTVIVDGKYVPVEISKLLNKTKEELNKYLRGELDISNTIFNKYKQSLDEHFDNWITLNGHNIYEVTPTTSSKIRKSTIVEPIINDSKIEDNSVKGVIGNIFDYVSFMQESILSEKSTDIIKDFKYNVLNKYKNKDDDTIDTFSLLNKASVMFSKKISYIKNRLANFYVDEEGNVLSILDKNDDTKAKLLKIISENPEKRLELLHIMSEIKGILSNNTIIRSLDITAQDPSIQKALHEIQNNINGLNDGTLDTISTFLYNYFSSISNHPFIKDIPLLNILTPLYSSSYFNTQIGDINETTNPFLQVIFYKINSDLETSRKYAKSESKRIKNIIKKYKNKGINWDHIIDSSTGKFISSCSKELLKDYEFKYNQFIESRNKYNIALEDKTKNKSFDEKVDIIYNDYDLYTLYKKYLEDRLEYEKFLNDNFYQKINKSYYDQKIQIEEEALKYPYLYVVYKQLTDLRNDLYKQINGNSVNPIIQENLDNVESKIQELLSIDKVKDEEIYFPFDEIESDTIDITIDPIKEFEHAKESLTYKDALDNYINHSNAINKLYFDKFSIPGFNEELKRNLDIIKNAELNNPNEEELFKNEQYKVAIEWVVYNAKVTEELEDKELESELNKAFRILKTEKSLKYNSLIKVFKRNHENLITYDGEIDASVLTEDEIKSYKKLELTEHFISDFSYYSSRALIKQIKDEPIIFTRDFYSKLRNFNNGNYDIWRTTIRQINDILIKYINKGIIDFGTIYSNSSDEEKENIIKDLEELSVLYRTLYDNKFHETKESIKDKAEHKITQEGDDLYKSLSTVVQSTNDQDFIKAWNGVNKIDGNINVFLYGSVVINPNLPDEERKKIIDVKKMKAVELIDNTYKKVHTKAYKREYNKRLGTPDFDKWWRENHVYDPSTGNIEPLKIWTKNVYKSHVQLSKDNIEGFTSRWFNMDREIKDEHLNQKWKKSKNLAVNYNGSEKYINSDLKNQTDDERELSNLLQEEIYKVTKTTKGIQWLDEGYVPAQHIANDSKNSVRKELLKLVGWNTTCTGKERYDDKLDYTKLRLGIEPMLQLYDQTELDSNIIAKPIKKPNQSEQDYIKEIKEYERQIKELNENNEKAHAAAINKDWESVITSYIEEAIKYNSLNAIGSLLDFGRYYLDTNKIYEAIAGKKTLTKDDLRISSNLINQYDTVARRILFNQYKEPSGDRVKWASRIQSFTSAQFMMMNIKGGISNILTGATQIAGEIWAKEYIGVKAWRKGLAMWSGSIHSQFAAMNDDKALCLEDAIIKNFYVIEYDQQTGKTVIVENPSTKPFKMLNNIMYSPQMIGENMLHNSVLLGLTTSTKILEDKETNTIKIQNKDEYIRTVEIQSLKDYLKTQSEEIQNKFNEFISNIQKDDNLLKDYAWFKEDIISYFVKNNLNDNQQKEFIKFKKEAINKAEKEFDNLPNLLSNFELKDGYLVFKKDSLLDKYNVYDKYGQNKTEELLSKFRNRVISINKKLHGVYDKLGQAQIEKHWWGSLVMQYHKYIWPGILKRWRIKGYYNEERGSVEKGSMISLWHFVTTPIKEHKRKNGLTNEETNAIGGIQNIFKEILDFIAHIDVNWNLLPEHEKANIRRNLGDIKGWLASLLIALATKAIGDDDDEETSIIYNLAMYQADRLNTESIQLSWIPSIFSESKKLWSKPIAAQSTVEDIINTLKFVTDWMYDEEFNPVYETGRFAGENKFTVRLMRRIPIYRGIYTSLFDIIDNNNYYSMSENMLDGFFMKRALEWVD